MAKGTKIAAGNGHAGQVPATIFMNRMPSGSFFQMRQNLAQNVVQCGDFSCSTNWVLGPGWTIGSGVASFDGTQISSALTQNALVIGQKYSASMQVVTCTQGKVRIGDGATNAERNSPGMLFVDFTAQGTKLSIEADQDAGSNFIGSVDNVVCRVRAV